MVIWLTGLSGSGKSTLAFGLDSFLKEQGIESTVLDADELRKHITSDLGFSRKDRKSNAMRIAFSAGIFSGIGIVTIVSAITPYEEDRLMVREILKDHTPYFIYVKCTIEECERRDPKGLYKRARAGELEAFTGISDPFEEPKKVELTIDTEQISVDEAVLIIYKEINKLNF